MTDFISRMGAIEALGEEPLVWCDRDEYGNGVNDQWRFDVKALKAVPTADVVERKKGKWETEIRTIHGYKIPFPVCSVCGKYAVDEYIYCPNCGAQMKSE